VTTPRTEAGRALLDAFQARAMDAPDAIRLNSASVIRHAIPRIEAEARAQAFADVRAAVGAMDAEPHPRGVAWQILYRDDVLAALDRLEAGG
jgi:hypothetical protein